MFEVVVDMFFSLLEKKKSSFLFWFGFFFATDLLQF